MSTYFATFKSWKSAQGAANELVNGGVSPDDLSLLLCHPGNRRRVHGEIRDLSTSVGDATSFVGRPDDPEKPVNFSGHADLSELTTTEVSRLSPIDTSNSDTDVDSVDQMEDSQEEMEQMIHPRDGISYGDHEKDDLALTVLTGYPTAVQNKTEDPLDPFDQADQSIDSLEMIDIPGVGLIIGGGSLATAALDLAGESSSIGSDAFVAQLIDEGVPEEEAKEFQRRFTNGEAILAVTVTPGELDEGAIEEVAERNGALTGALYDAPRY